MHWTDAALSHCIRWVKTLTGFSNRTLAYPEVFESIPESTDRYMVIIEPRRYDLLEHVLR
jgi:hypothetical protein